MGNNDNILISFWKIKIVQPIAALLRQGITPEKIALSIAFGITLGVFPALLAPTILCTFAALALRLNLPTIQLINYLVYPLWAILLLPFFRAGELLFNAEHLPISVKQLTDMADRDLWGTVKLLWDTTVHAIGVWFLTAPVVTVAIYYTLTPILRRSLGLKIVGLKIED